MAQLEKLEKQILEFLAEHPDECFTRDQIAAATGLRLSTVCGRVNKLLDPLKCQNRIWIEELPAQRQASGRSAHPVRIYRPVGQLELPIHERPFDRTKRMLAIQFGGHLLREP